MDNPAFVSGRQRLGYLHGAAQQMIERQRTFPQAPRCAWSGLRNVLHHQVRHAFLFANVVQRANVRMIQGRRSLRLALEANPEVGTLRSFGMYHLDRHQTSQARVARAKHLAHSAFPQQHFQLIRAQPRARP